MNPVKITQDKMIATVVVEVDLNEWGKYPDDDGVLNRASLNLQKVREAVKVDAVQIIDAKIVSLQVEKQELNDIKPVVILDDAANAVVVNDADPA